MAGTVCVLLSKGMNGQRYKAVHFMKGFLFNEWELLVFLTHYSWPTDNFCTWLYHEVGMGKYNSSPTEGKIDL